MLHKNFDEELRIIPDFPRTRHLPIQPNAQRDDLIASWDDARWVFNRRAENELSVIVEEKVDAANVGMTIHQGEPLIRNRNYILRKGYGRKNTPAKLQYAPIWTWFYSNVDKFEKAEKLFGFKPTIYGEWMYARHTVAYDLLPNYFLAFDVFNPEIQAYVSPEIYRPVLKDAGFSLVPFVAFSTIGFTTTFLMNQRDKQSEISTTDMREGIYIKVCEDDRVIERFKMVRPGFIPGEHWNNKGELTKNKLKK